MTSYSQRMLDELDAGQMDEAKKSFALALRHDDDETVHSLAEELYALGFSNNAKRAYLKLLDKYPDEDLLRTELAEIAISEDQTDEALMYLSNISADSDAYLEALLVFADLYQSDGLPEAAELKLMEAYRLAPDEPVIQFALAEFYNGSAKYSEAIPFYRGLLATGERYFSGVDIVSRIGVAYALIGDNEKALAYLEQIKAAEMTSDVRFQLGMIYAGNEETQDQAVAEFEKLIDLDASYAAVYNPLGRLYEQREKLEQALSTYQAGLAVDQFNVKSYENAARVARRLGDDTQAERLYTTGLANTSDNLILVNDYTQLLLDHERFVEMINLLNDYLEDDEIDIDPQWYWDLARAYTGIESYEMATKYWHAAMPFFIDNDQFLKSAYFYFRDEGEQILAKEALKQYVQLNPEDYEMVALYETEEE
ncbi:tetratricopeptide repeat protein [Weissella diestrammenae]|uniref:Tetratricopeptide repeat protein n=1 Tax=Weissella diestrammenae TaxID=1162633 RepID=A0A7G9T5J5_9LACO|nr:tetratricopeptide repeat protein [Weissella diestrammenae]MCM0582196.1 tetratricopeptide repeat protein [Weissella diestrammenae]QNN75370.1 tetratricopeptide repeat protein [Weissella diestrammenae]